MTRPAARARSAQPHREPITDDGRATGPHQPGSAPARAVAAAAPLRRTVQPVAHLIAGHRLPEMSALPKNRSFGPVSLFAGIERGAMQPQPPGNVLPFRRADAGSVRLGDRDITGLMLCGQQYGAPYDLLAAALEVRADRLRGIVARWRRTGYAQTGTLATGPAWCWLTAAGMKATGLGYPATRPSLGRLAHIRAVLAVRLWLEGGRPIRRARHGGAANAASAPPLAARPAACTCPMRRSTGPAWTGPPTRGRSGPLRRN